MNLQLDPEYLRTSMSMWRDAVDMKIPIHDDFKIHFMERRSELLKGFVDTARSWRMVLLCCSPSAEGDKADLDALREEVAAFKDWAEKGLHELRALGKPD